MILCYAMHIGTTFAWFTDSVTTGTNKIIDGNLDIGLQYITGGENRVDVTEGTNLFISPAETLW